MNILPLLGLIFFTAFCSYLIKLFADNLEKAKALFAQYLFCAFFIFLFWLFFDRTLPPLKVFLIISGGLALINYLSSYFLWSAYKIKMGRTALYLPWSGLIAIALYFIFLNEYQGLGILALVGVFLYLAATGLFYLGQRKKEKNNIKTKSTKNNFWPWFFLVLAMVILGGLIVFFIKILSFNITRTHFLLSWYFGNFIFSSLALTFTKEKIKPIKKKLFYLMPLLSLGIVLNMACFYWAFQLNTGTLVVAFNTLNSVIIPLLVGWLFFNEKKGLNKLELSGFISGTIAAVLIIWSLYY